MSQKKIDLVLMAILLAMPLLAYAESGLTLTRAVLVAQENDPWLSRSRSQQAAQLAKSVSSAALPDPTASFALFNFPVDTFDISQEPITQLRFGISQMFPRGATRSLQKQKYSILGEQEPFQRANRRAQLSVSVALLWLEAFLARETISLIESHRELFEYLVDVSQSSYSSAFGKTRQQDIVRAQLELTRLEDRLVVLGERHDVATSRLTEWVGFDNNYATSSRPGRLTLSREIPDLKLAVEEVLQHEPGEQAMMLSHFVHHPLIKALDSQIAASQTNIELARQKYKLQWGLNASYGYRDDELEERADLLTVGVVFDLPVFRANRQDQEVKAAVATAEATKTDRVMALRNMYAGYQSIRSRLVRLNGRQALYQQRLLKEMSEQAEASLTAYTRDDGDFAEVMRARIDELNARIDALDIDVQRLKSIVQLNYYLVSDNA